MADNDPTATDFEAAAPPAEPPAEPPTEPPAAAPPVVTAPPPAEPPAAPPVVAAPAAPEEPLAPPTEQPFDADQARLLANTLIHKYFTTQLNALTNHHLSSYDQFISRDISLILKSRNPLIYIKNHKEDTVFGPARQFKYQMELYFGGPDGTDIEIGTPVIQHTRGTSEDVRLMFPNEARLRNLNYVVPIDINVHYKILVKSAPDTKTEKPDPVLQKEDKFKIHLCKFPLMLHSKFCILNGKPESFLREMGECPQDPGGYFVINGSEKVLTTRQEGGFNILWTKKLKSKAEEPKYQYRSSMASLNPYTREVSRIDFMVLRERTVTKRSGTVHILPSIEVQLRNVIKPIPVFVLFRALGVITDKEIFQHIFGDLNSPEAKLLVEHLHPSVVAAHTFKDQYSALMYIQSLTKSRSIYFVLDIIQNQMFSHIESVPGAKVAFLGECVRKILRVMQGLEQPPSRDDTKNQRLVTSGFLCQMLFQNMYNNYLVKVKRVLDEAFNYNESMYSDQEFEKLISEDNRGRVFPHQFLSDGIMRGFKGKWMTGNNREEQGVLQELSRLSYLDFISHLRHAILNFDKSKKIADPRMLHTSQYGYFCTAETPSGASIGITKNLTIMTAISGSMLVKPFLEWLYTRGSVIQCKSITPDLRAQLIPVYINAGIVGYVGGRNIGLLLRVLRLMKRTGCLPPLSSSGFNVPERHIFIRCDEGRPLRPLIFLRENARLPPLEAFQRCETWRDCIVGSLPGREKIDIDSREFFDPLQEKRVESLEDYIAFLEPHQGVIEYIDPDEQNQILIANWPNHIVPESTHMEVHPSTILGLLGSCIPFPNHNQSPRNQLSSSQSKQSVSIYATNWMNRFDNTANVLCYGQAPLVRSVYQDYFGSGKMPYGQNVILAMGVFSGYNQEDGVIMNADALARGQFRSINYRSYEAFEEKDEMAHTETFIGNPTKVPAWTSLKPQLNYGKLDDDGIVKIGEYVDQYTVIVGRYSVAESGDIADASVTPQVWTRGRVEEVSITVNNLGRRLVKVRIVQDRVPELGDKFSNRHGQKGTLNMMYRSWDMPRTAEGITPDMIMNPTAIPSRMTIGQILEMLLGITAAEIGAVGNCTAFMNDGSPHEVFGQILERLGMHKMGNQVLYSGMTGEQIQADIYMGVVYGMRLKHMTEDKWNARGQGRKEARTHQPTGGRGNEGGLKIGEMDRDAILGHGISTFLQESMTKRSDGTMFMICNGCGTFPIYNKKQNLHLCPICDGPLEFAGNKAETMEPIPPSKRSAVTFSQVEMPYATKLFFQEMDTFANIGMRVLTTRDTTQLTGVRQLQDITEQEYLMLESLELEPLVVKPTEPPQANVADEFGKQPPTAAEVTKALEKIDVTMKNEVAAAAANAAAASNAYAGNYVNRSPVYPAAPAASPQGVQQPGVVQYLVPRPPAATAAAAAPGGPDLALASVAPLPFSQQPNGEARMTEAGVPLAAAPAVLPQAPQQGGQAFFQQHDGEIMVGGEGVPILTVDTSDPALVAEGLKMPKDATSSLAPMIPMMQDGGQAPRRQRRQNSPSPSFAPMPQQQQPQEVPQNPQAPVRVIKEG